jgi:hypothetical protein
MPGLAESGACLQCGGVNDLMESARRWRALVCPDCRFVFRVPKNHDGKGVVCPSCRRLLRIPGPDDESPPLLVAFDEKAGEEVLPGVRRRRRIKKRVGRDIAWDDEKEPVSVGKQQAFRMGWLLMVGVFLLAGLLGWLGYTMKRQPETSGQIALPDVTEIVLPEVPVASPSWYDMEAVEKLSRAFLAATSVEELLPLIRDTERLEPAIRRYYPEGKLEKMELTGLGVVQDSMQGEWRAVTLYIDAKSFPRLFLNVCETADGLKVDWESWVGHSLMPWEEIIEKKPTDPVLVRVMLSGVDYYNMDFSNDAEWRSCRMLSPDGEDLLYGYVRVGSDEEVAIIRTVSSDPTGNHRMSLMIRYPAGARSKNQVIIDRVVADKWLIPDTKP